MGRGWVGRVKLTRRLAWLLLTSLISSNTIFFFCTLLFYIYLYDGLNNVCLSYQVRRLTRAGTVCICFAH